MAAALPFPATITYNIYATDGWITLTDGSPMYIYGYVGGVAGQPLTYLNYDWAIDPTSPTGLSGTGAVTPVNLPGGPPPVVGGPLNPGTNPIEAQLAGHAQYPGPLITCRAGDTVIINFKNLGVTNLQAAGNDPHTIHLHGLDVVAAVDGVPETSIAAIPAGPLVAGVNFPAANTLPGAGNVVVYQFSPKNPGTYFYHCHQEADIHVQMGMIGELIVYNQNDASFATGPGPNSGGGTDFGWKYDRDYTMILQEFDSSQHLSEAGLKDWWWGTNEDFTGPLTGSFNPVNFQANYWFINGLSFPNTIHVNTGIDFNTWLSAHPGMDPFVVGSHQAKLGRGEKVLVRACSLAFSNSPMHVHGFHPKVIAHDERANTWGNPAGTPTGKGDEVQTIDLPSGSAYDLLFDFATQDANAVYPTGTQTRYDPATGLPLSNTISGAPVIPFDVYQGGPSVPNLFPWHNHNDFESTNNGVYPGGMFTMVAVMP